ncbi:DNA polymerase III subunit delta' [Aneurinibacillus thermoaerophilus]|uniref:DNA polymerase III subunit delta' n=1 Tax=Aneurinibacillus thermoaerophilus TaxID=143495 RepID=UPI002E225526|nr:DNA polymerase III subunit delta' [Aneurinibacillus thermoaerophilus]MED0765448.1 DNA polymerase III subunit delta' [Aneurinibacillus thermoaerophilus]
MWSEFPAQKQVAELLYRSLKHNRLSHAYLFSGPKGAGKKKVAKHFAKAIFCLKQNGDSCGICKNCRLIEERNHFDVHWIEPERNIIRIKQVEDLQKKFSYRAAESSHKVYIMDEADKMNQEATNRLLKFLEEPPQGVVAILLTSRIQDILPTILSRCQIITFAAPSPEIIAKELEQAGVKPGLARAAAQIANDVEEARRLCETESFAQLRSLVIQLSEDILERGTYALVTIHDKFLKQEKATDKIDLFLDLFLLWFRDLLFFSLGKESQITNKDQMEPIQKQALRMSQRRLVDGMGTILVTKNRLTHYANLQLSLEDMVLRLQEG